MKLLVVSLKRSVARRERIKKQLTEMGVTFQFFDATDGQQEQFPYLERNTPQKTKLRKGYSLHRNEIACFSSHIRVWEYCVAIDEPVVVLEDNVDILAPLDEFLSEAESLISQYNYLKLSATRTKRMTFSEDLAIQNGYVIGRYSKNTCGTTAYIISPYAAERLMQNANVIIEPVDDYMSKVWRHQICSYSVKPVLFKRADITSTISSDRKTKQKMTVFNKVFSELFRIYESIMRYLYRNKL